MNCCRLCRAVVGRPRTYRSVQVQRAMYGPTLRSTHKPAAALTAAVVPAAADEFPGLRSSQLQQSAEMSGHPLSFPAEMDLLNVKDWVYNYTLHHGTSRRDLPESEMPSLDEEAKELPNGELSLRGLRSISIGPITFSSSVMWRKW